MNTTEHDAFTDAATAAYEDYVRTPKMNVGTFRDRIAEAYMDAAMWARDHLARQEPTDAEVEAAAIMLCASAHHERVWEALAKVDPARRARLRIDARAALTAAREAQA